VHLIEWLIANPVKVSVGVILLCLFGVIAAGQMPVQLTPEVQIPTLTVETRWPGASPQEVEREIILEQEEQLQSVEGLRKMTSESMDSMGRITLEFAIGTDMNEVLMLVNTRLQQVREYPENADEPVISTSNASDRPIAWFILTPRPPTREQFAAAREKHPDLADRLTYVEQTANAGLLLYRLRQLCNEHPDLAMALTLRRPRPEEFDQARERYPELTSQLTEIEGMDDRIAILTRLQELSAQYPDLKPLVSEIDVTTERRFAEDFIEARFERVDGVSNANVMGGREEEMQVIVDPERLAARYLTISDVRAALRGQNMDTSAGDLWEGKRRYVIRTLGQFRTPQQVENVILSRPETPAVYLRDVAQVRLGYKKPDGMVRRYGTSVIAINAMRETGANVLDVMEGLRQATQEVNDHVLADRGLYLSQVYDETEYIHSAMWLVEENVIEGAVLTFIVLLLFLRSVRSTLVVFLSITVSIIGMFLVMKLLGRSLNVPSLAGIAFAVGMLVDNFIVVLENIYRHHQLGEPAVTAVVKGTKEVWGAVVAATLANLAVFIPVLFVQDEAGQLFRDIALATSAAVALSLLVALTVVPTAARQILRRDEPEEDVVSGFRPPVHPAPPSRNLFVRGIRGARTAVRRTFAPVLYILRHLLLWPLDRFGALFVEAVVGVNRWLIHSVMRRLAVVAVLVGVSGLLIWVLFPKVEYLPSGNRNLVFGIILPPPGYNLDYMTTMGEQIENSLRTYWDVDPNSPAAAKLDYPVIGDFFYVARGRQLFLGLRAHDPMRARELEGLVQQVGRQLPGTIVIAKQSSLFEQGLTAGRTVEVEIVGPHIEKLVAVGGQMMGRIQAEFPPPADAPPGTPGVQARPVPSLDLSSPELHVLPKWDQAADSGVNAVDLGYTVNALIDGAYAADYYMGGDKIDLTIVGNADFAINTQDLRALSIALPQGQTAPVEAVANVEYRSGPEQINRRERQRAITIEVTPPAHIALEDAMDRIRNNVIAPMREEGLLDGIPEPNLAGTADKLKTTWTSLRWNLALAVLITYLLMAALFESWLYPAVIILSVPLGAVGGLAGLWLLNAVILPEGVVQPLDVLTMLGFIILVGTVVNNPILIVEQALVHMREENMGQRHAVLESVRTRIRPIFMTAMIGLFGLLPLVISPGAGSELYRGIGSVLLGGLLVSTVFTLILVPCLFTLTLEAKHYFYEGWRKLVAPTFGAEAVVIDSESPMKS
jgi:HAE1 family hydrophobic/amphiphilic exporter-1